MNPAQNTQAVSTIQAKQEIEFQPFGGEDRIKLSLSIIKNYIATPTKEGELPDDRDAMKFMMLCRSRRLNPFENDCFLIGYKKRDAAKADWSLITSISAFYKRAEIHPEFDGIESGVIVKDSEDRLTEREGDITYEGETLLGGWATVHFKNRRFPMRRKARLQTYLKSFGVWVTDPAGMIVKVAECQALRDSFPTMLGGMLLREEATDVESTVTAAPLKRPSFSRGLPAPDIGTTPGKVVQMPGAASPKAPETAQDAPDGVKTPEKEQTQPQQPPANATAPANASSEPAETSGTETEQAQKTEKAPEPAPYKPSTPFEPRKNETPELTEVRYLLWKCGKTEDALLPILRAKKLGKDDQKLEHLSSKRLADIAKSWDSAFLPELNKAQ